MTLPSDGKEHPAPTDTKGALEIAARQFRQYESHHRSKGGTANPAGPPADAVMKAEVNRMMAEMCEEASAALISPPTPQTVARDGLDVILSFGTHLEAADALDEINKVFRRRATEYAQWPPS